MHSEYYSIYNHPAAHEVKIASNWWTSKIDRVTHKQAYTFRLALEGLIFGRIYNHWYPENPAKGSGYRAIINDYHVDQLLKIACKSAGFHHSKLPGQCVLLINPGSVKIRSLLTDEEEVIYEKSLE